MRATFGTGILLRVQVKRFTRTAQACETFNLIIHAVHHKSYVQIDICQACCLRWTRAALGPASHTVRKPSAHSMTHVLPFSATVTAVPEAKRRVTSPAARPVGVATALVGAPKGREKSGE